MSRYMRIASFIKNANELAESGTAHSMHVRQKRNSTIWERRFTEIRSTKHTADAFYFDELGNLIALFDDGSVRQYITKEEQRNSGLLR